MPDQEWLLCGLQNSCQPVVKSAVDLDGWPEEEPIDLGVRPIKKPSRRKGAPAAQAAQRAKRRHRGRGHYSMRL